MKKLMNDMELAQVHGGSDYYIDDISCGDGVYPGFDGWAIDISEWEKMFSTDMPLA